MGEDAAAEVGAELAFHEARDAAIPLPGPREEALELGAHDVVEHALLRAAAVPVHFKVADGSTEDSTTRHDSWELLRRLVGSPRFLYVADSKLCTWENLRHIHREGGWFLTVLPRSRKEERRFKDWIQEHAFCRTRAAEELATAFTRYLRGS